MSTLYCLITITDRERLPQFRRLYEEQQISVAMTTLGHGTATGELLSYIGLTRSEKAVSISAVTGEHWEKLKRLLERRLRIDVPGTGIAFIVPFASIGGRRELAYLTDGQDFRKEEESSLKATAHELLIVISNQGYNELVMEAARSAGAGGGTVIHAKGTGEQHAAKFLGVSLASEKDMVFIVTPTARKNAIMSAIMEQAGMESKAKSIVFSLPVTDTAGLRLIEESAE